MDRIMEEVERLRSKCVMCGRCSSVCPSLRHGGCDPAAVMSGDDDLVLQCIGCGNCSRICRKTDPFRVMQDLICVKKGIRLSDAFAETSYSVPAQAVADLVPRWSGEGVDVMPGCMVRCKVPYVEYAASAALESMGIAARELPGNTCCMHPIQFRNMTGDERDAYKKKMELSAGGKPFVTLCAGCSEELSESGVKTEHMIPFLYENLDKLPSFENPPRIALEPGCSASADMDKMRTIAEKMGCVVTNSSWGCCGKYSPVSESLMREREEECSGADLIVVGCPMCLIRYDDFPGGLPAVHICELVAMASGDFSTLDRHKIKARIGDPPASG